MLPKHGRIDCSICFPNSSTEAKPHPDWRMVNDPGAWGGSEPTYLVLGFSKGSTQADIYAKGGFDQVAFAGMRSRLELALRHFGALAPTASIDRAIADPEGDIAFGSLIRCSVSRLTKGGAYECSGALIKKSFVEIPEVISACTNRFLTELPSSVRVVFLLGNDTGYVRQCQSLLERLFPQNFEPVNDMAVIADGRTWVHISHPSGSNGHFDRWLNGRADEKGVKRVLVEEALGRSISKGKGGRAQENEHVKTIEPKVQRQEAAINKVSNQTAAKFCPKTAEHILSSRLQANEKPTKKMIGFQTRLGRQVALERDKQSVHIWIEDVDSGLSGIEIKNQSNPGMPYMPSQGRHSNLRSQAPKLQAGNKAYYLHIENQFALETLIEWYDRS